jgi:Kef-type K+ transport system membrane component KefB
LSASAALGALFGIGMPALLRALRPGGQDATLAFAIAVILLVTVTRGLKLSPVLATLTFGLLARHRRVVLGHAQRGFGALGDLFSLILFVFVAACIQWDMVWSGLAMGLAIVLARQLAKIAGVTLLAHCSGISWRKGALTGVAMAPISAFVILTLEQTRHLGVDLFDQLAPLAAAALLLEVSGPMLTQLALRLAAEIPAKEN